MEQMRQKVVSLGQKYSDWLDDASSESARNLTREIQRLEDAIQTGKNPRTLQDITKSIISKLQGIAETGSMDHRHANELEDQFNELLQQLRKI